MKRALKSFQDLENKLGSCCLEELMHMQFANFALVPALLALAAPAFAQASFEGAGEQGELDCSGGTENRTFIQPLGRKCIHRSQFYRAYSTPTDTGRFSLMHR